MEHDDCGVTSGTVKHQGCDLKPTNAAGVVDPHFTQGQQDLFPACSERKSGVSLPRCYGTILTQHGVLGRRIVLWIGTLRISACTCYRALNVV